MKTKFDELANGWLNQSPGDGVFIAGSCGVGRVAGPGIFAGWIGPNPPRKRGGFLGTKDEPQNETKVTEAKCDEVMRSSGQLLPLNQRTARLMRVLVLALTFAAASEAAAQIFTTIYTFAPLENTNNAGIFTNSTGALPVGGVVLRNNILYGTAAQGGSSGNGTVFSVNSDGTGFATLYNFSPYSGYVMVDGFPYGINPDGALPGAPPLLSGNTLYGTAPVGGSFGSGAVFSLDTASLTYTTIHSFDQLRYSGTLWTNSDGALPSGPLMSGNTLYGTASRGGSSLGNFTSGSAIGMGTVFAVNADGSGFSNLHAFSATSGPVGTNSDGANPGAVLVLSGNTLYGTAGNGGISGAGTVFSINTNGSEFRILHSFSSGAEGVGPGALILGGDTLYGATGGGGGGGLGAGTIFSINTDGTGLKILHTFASAAAFPPYTNSGGAFPAAPLILSGNILYGTTRAGGAEGQGTVFKIGTDGSHFRTLYDFTTTSGSPGAGSLALEGNILYGTAAPNNSSNTGIIFSLLIRPEIILTQFGLNAVLSWPTNAIGFHLEATTNVTPPVVWTSNLPPAVVVNGLNTVTNPISGLQQYYRLSQ